MFLFSPHRIPSVVPNSDKDKAEAKSKTPFRSSFRKMVKGQEGEADGRMESKIRSWKHPALLGVPQGLEEEQTPFHILSAGSSVLCLSQSGPALGISQALLEGTVAWLGLLPAARPCCVCWAFHQRWLKLPFQPLLWRASPAASPPPAASL